MLEERGFSTVAIASVRAQAEKTRPPRALWTTSQLGRPLGEPERPVFQRRVLLAALGLLERPDGPVILEDFQRRSPRVAGHAGLARAASAGSPRPAEYARYLGRGIRPGIVRAAAAVAYGADAVWSHDRRIEFPGTDGLAKVRDAFPGRRIARGCPNSIPRHWPCVCWLTTSKRSMAEPRRPRVRHPQRIRSTCGFGGRPSRVGC